MGIPVNSEQATTIITTTLQHRLKKVVNGVFNSNPVLLRMYADERVTIDGGKNIETPIEHGMVVGGAVPKGGDFSGDVSEIITMFTHNWKTNYAGLNFYDLDLAMNQGAAAVIKITDAVMSNAKRTLQHNLGTQLHGSGGGDNFDGFFNAVSTTATYGGIARGDGSTVATAVTPTVNTTGGPFSLAMVNEAMGNATFDNIQPNLIVSNQTIFSKAWERSQPSERNSPGNTMRKIGWKGNVLNFNGAEWVVDSHTPSGTIEVWNTDFWKFMILRGNDFKIRGKGIQQLTLKDTSAGQLIVRGNFICSGPRYQSYISNVT